MCTVLIPVYSEARIFQISYQIYKLLDATEFGVQSSDNSLYTNTAPHDPKLCAAFTNSHQISSHAVGGC